MSSNSGPPPGALAGLAAGAALAWAAILTLWLGTEAWTDYAALAVGSLAAAALLMSGIAWIDESTSA